MLPFGPFLEVDTCQRSAQQLAGRSDEGMPLQIFVVARLFSENRELRKFLPSLAGS